MFDKPTIRPSGKSLLKVVNNIALNEPDKKTGVQSDSRSGSIRAVRDAPSQTRRLLGVELEEEMKQRVNDFNELTFIGEDTLPGFGSGAHAGGPRLDPGEPQVPLVSSRAQKR